MAINLSSGLAEAELGGLGSAGFHVGVVFVEIIDALG